MKDLIEVPPLIDMKKVCHQMTTTIGAALFSGRLKTTEWGGDAGN